MALYGKIRAKLGGKPFCTMVVLAAGSSKRMGRDKLMTFSEADCDIIGIFPPA